jgi:N-acetylglutamate synthase-like GNAT family acetyltransferase
MNITFRKANREDVPEIVRLLNDDELGTSREQYNGIIPESYYSSFDAINTDENNYLLIAELNKKVVGTMQLTFTTYMTYQGGKRMQIEGVRVDKKIRDKGIGKLMFEWAINKAKEENCHLVQLTTDKRRPDALEFYKKLGFVASHEGLKLRLEIG